MKLKIYKFYNSFLRYKKKYGLIISVRIIFHYFYRIVFFYRIHPIKNMIKVNGYEMYINNLDKGISPELALFKIHEPINTKILSNLINEGMTCLDIGGNIGYYPILERKLVGETGEIIVVEPLRENFQLLEKNIKNHKFENVFLHNVALGDYSGKAYFIIENAKNNSYIIKDLNQIPEPSRGTLNEVEMKQSDIFIENLNLKKLDFIRMDLEGFELILLKSIQNAIKKYKPIISMELHCSILGNDKTKELLNFLRDNMYEIITFMERDLDIPKIGKISDVKKMNLDELEELIENKEVGNFLMLNFVQKDKREI